MFTHSFLMMQQERLPHLVLYQLMLVNYGEFASPGNAETFGGSTVGIARDDGRNVRMRVGLKVLTVRSFGQDGLVFEGRAVPLRRPHQRVDSRLNVTGGWRPSGLC